MRRLEFNMGWTYGRAQAVLRPLAAGRLTLTVANKNGEETETVLDVKE